MPRRLEVAEPDGRPRSDDEGATWRQVVEIWWPGGIYLRAYCAGAICSHYGDHLGLVAVRLRFASVTAGEAAFKRLSQKWEGQKKADLREVDRPVGGALLREWARRDHGPGAELWVVPFGAPISAVWADHAPEEVTLLVERRELIDELRKEVRN